MAHYGSEYTEQAGHKYLYKQYFRAKLLFWETLNWLILDMKSTMVISPIKNMTAENGGPAK